MKRLHRILITSALCALLSMVFPARALPPGTGFNKTESPTPTGCDTSGTSRKATGTVAYSGATQLWPPNHKYTTGTISLTGDANDDKDTVGFMTLAYHNQVTSSGEEFVGSGKPDDAASPDISPAAEGSITDSGKNSVTFNDYRIRVERSGTDQGSRIYTIEAHLRVYDHNDGGDDGSTEDCVVKFHICVPHDMRASRSPSACPPTEVAYQTI